MKYGSRNIIGILLVIASLAACGPNATGSVVPTSPTLTETATSAPATITVIHTPGPSEAERPTPTTTPTALLSDLKSSNGPEKDVSSYRLRAWTAAHDAALDANLKKFLDREEFGHFVYPAYLTAFEQERLLKNPEAPFQMESIWKIILNKPGTSAVPGMNNEPDVMAFYLQNVLQNTPLTELASALEKDTTHKLITIQSVVLKNATGNGQDGLAVLVETPVTYNPSMTAVYVIYPASGGYHRIEKVRDWQTSGALGGAYRSFEILDVGDTNGNRLPEFVLRVELGMSGDPIIARQDIEHYEWSNQAGKFAGKIFPVFEQGCDPGMFSDISWGPCEGKWGFTREGVKGLLRIQSFWSNLYNCPDIILQSEWIWNGTEYAPRPPVWLAPDASFSSACRLAWAEEMTAKDPRGLAILEESLENWPPEADEFFGPAGRDFLQLRLGIWNDLQGNNIKAKDMLQQIITQPAAPEFSFAASLAQKYLDERTKTGKVGACIAAQAMLDSAYQSSDSGEDTWTEFDSDDPDTTEFFGFSYADNRTSICNVYTDVLPTEIARANLSTPKALQTWLAQAGINIHQTIALDMNSDKKEDLLVLMDTDRWDSYDLWAFPTSDSGYRAVYIDSFWGEDSAKLEVRPVKVGPNSSYILAQMGSELILFDASKGNSWYEADVLSYQVQDGSFPARVKVEWDAGNGPKTTTYIWDSAEKDFSPLKKEEELAPFDSAQTEIEQMIYIQQDYAGAIVATELFLQQHIEEPLKEYSCYQSECEYLPDWYLPYFRYLSAVAYEQLGQEQDAIKAYYELWRDYPENVFGMVASLKLEQATP